MTSEQKTVSTEAVLVLGEERSLGVSRLSRIAAAKCGECLFRTLSMIEGKSGKRDICPGVLLLAGVENPSHERAFYTTARGCADRTDLMTVSQRVDSEQAVMIAAQARSRLGSIGLSGIAES